MLAGYDPDDPRSIDTPVDSYAPEDLDLEGVRIAVPINFFFDDATVSTYCATCHF